MNRADFVTGLSLLTWGFGLCALPLHAQTTPPNSMNFQGRLATPSGNPVPNGTYSILFSLYDALTGGTLKYSKTVSNVQVKNGTFAVTLDAFPAGTFNGNLWLEVKIGSDVPLAPRTPLVSVPYAMKSTLALTVPDGSITTASLANGAVTNAKVTDVAWSKITGAPSTLLTLPYVAARNVASPGILFSLTNTGTGDSIYAQATDGTAIHGKSNNIAVWAESTNAAAVYGYSVNVSGVFGVSNNSYGVYGYGNTNYGVYGKTLDNTKAGTVGENNNGNMGFLGGPNYGVAGSSNSGYGVVGSSTNGSAVYGSSVNGYGVYGISTSSDAVYGMSGTGNGASFTTGGTNGVYAVSNGSNGNGILGVCSNGAGAYGVYGLSSTGYGVVGVGHLYGVYSNGQAAGTTGWANISDIRYKQDIAPIDNALETILNLRGVTYEYRRGAFPNMNFPKGRHIGFIAQEVEEILPQIVLTNTDGYKSITYTDAVPVLVEAVKTLNARSVIQQKQNDALRAENAALKFRLDAIERALAEIRANMTSVTKR